MFFVQTKYLEFRIFLLDNIRIIKYNHDMKFEIPNIERGDRVYTNLLKAMKDKKITFTQIAELLRCQLNTVSDKTDGTVKSGFSIDEALLIKKVLFPEYDISYLFERESKVA